MFVSLLVTSNPEQPVRSPVIQATFNQPPASMAPDQSDRVKSSRERSPGLKFMASVAANAAGFAGLMAGCWLSLQLLQTFLP